MRKIHYILLGMKYTLFALLILFASLLIITNIYKFDIFDFSIYGATTLGLFFLFYYFDKIIWAVESRPRTGSESMPGKEGIAITDINNEGEVRVEGIIWHARSYNGKIINKGERVIVEGVEGIILIVRKI
ncbi:MAG: NfeD family protein [Thermoplasmata archaeon]|nr:hypothetical protein [Euryarchaeota archaeon]MVT35373.1 hypothetical protein [Euryarchaeota archaeon]